MKKTEKDMKVKVRFIVWPVVAMLVAGTFIMLWRQSRPAPEIYETVTPAVRDIVRDIIATGTIEARNKVEQKAAVTGTVRKICVKPGDEVRAGQVLVCLDVLPDAVRLSNARSEVEAAEIALDEADREAGRAQRLYEKGAVSRQALEQAQTAQAVARERLANARDMVETIGRGASGRYADDNAVVRALIGGRVLSVDVELGEMVMGASSFSLGTTVATVADMNDVIFRGTIDETQVAGLREGVDVRITPAAVPGLQINGVLEYVSSLGMVQNGSKMFEVKAAAAIPEGFSVRSGYSANARILVEKAEAVLSVDEGAVSFEEDGSYVYRLDSPVRKVKSQIWTKIPVVTGVSDGIYVEIKDGLTEGIILRGLKK